MSENSVIKVSPAVLKNGDVPALLSVPNVDPVHFVAPTGNATWTNYVGTTTAAFSAFATAGYVLIKMGTVLYRIPAFLAT